MKKLSFKTTLAMTASVAMLATANTAPAFAQDSGPTVDDEIITIGTRRKARSAADTTAPVDVISGTEFTNAASSDLSELLRANVPSYNVNTQPISDAATLVRPANLRGLSPDNTLVLLNGKRRHRAAVISFLGGGLADGAQGPDVSVFPSLALKQVEVLRDGASSQYGSDAIAGVMNFVLKDDAEGGSVMAKYGSTYDGDGDNFVVAGNVGLPLGDRGFVNVTAEYREADGTFRSEQRGDALSLIAAGNTAVASSNVNTVTDEFVQYWGNPDVKDDIKLFVNTGFEIGDNTEFYAFGNYATREAEGGFFYRNPTNRGGIYNGPQLDPRDNTTALTLLDDLGDDDSSNDIFVAADNTQFVRPDTTESILVGDLDGVGVGESCPAGIPLPGGENTAPDPNNALYQQVFSSDNCFSFIETIPGGFTPRFGGELEDISVVAGIKGEFDLGTGLSYDISGSYGENHADFFINNTVNASLGPLSPRSFDPGAYTQAETNFNFDLGYAMPIDGWAGDLNIAAGFEWRQEKFTVTAGDISSYTSAATLTPQQENLLNQGFAPNSNGFGGFTAASAGSNSQSNIALYTDLEADVSDALTLQGAVRWEDFDVFGDTLNFKVGGLYRISDALRIRGTYSTGFHAPTAGQANVVNVSTVFTSGRLVDRGTLPVTSSAAQLVTPGASLKAEKANNFSAGFAADIMGGNLTVDFFNIEVEDRISQSDDFDFIGTLEALAASNNLTLATGVAANTNNYLNLLGSNGVINRSDFDGFEGLTDFRTFANDFDTRTRGVDVVFNRPFEFANGDSKLTVIANYTDTKVTDQGALGNTRVRQLEENLPNVRGSATWSHDTGGMFSGFLRGNYYGSFYEAHLDDGTLPIEAGAEFTVDAEITAEVREGIKFSVGAENLLDNYPDRNPWASIVGASYPVTSPFGFNGGQYYARVRLDW